MPLPDEIVAPALLGLIAVLFGAASVNSWFRRAGTGRPLLSWAIVTGMTASGVYRAHEAVERPAVMASFAFAAILALAVIFVGGRLVKR